ncbi:MAG: 2-succinyl-5-enolpyruvyl-6-hydroxy-3-cyclohexene-1-carboxylic-acid synthase [Thiothrix sp.]|uniref:2-succinyl-5-enolpyruvyl-6-hydroxy-3- cyclohexene-1-carboxylic-acid synthase n=1 Tax=Thiothrix sp. TaxID=1032 RepID=UPI00261D11F9|nr:2-succinyl-5-enolpyruvyl-6-hydroxy-3-cyclohexene-1-carboxylic-acid synthase [Thiothrix sp.]MDD5395143.1 2-succinyl-5-enolpyruvyl-6-hydroxy-3-cyclohexene-1-carboxylic-acid synthase [Thiothrix sp.]
MQATDTGTVNLLWCAALLAGLVEAGVEEIVISPGSRNTPMTLVADLNPDLRCWVQIDERSAAFFALGMAKASCKPVALQCTSGTAAANWFSAVVEASQSGIPLILLTADRPWELQQCGANQTIDQIKLFGSHVRAFHQLSEADGSDKALRRVHQLAVQVVQESLWPKPGPVHINVPLREPLLPTGKIPSLLPPSPLAGEGLGTRGNACGTVYAPPAQLTHICDTISGKPGLIVCGEGVYDDTFPAVLMHLAQTLDAPVLADPLANLRFGGHVSGHLLSRYDAFLRDVTFTGSHIPQWVLRFGTMPVSRALQQYLSGSQLPLHIVVDGQGGWSDPLFQQSLMVRASPKAFCQQLATLKPQPAARSWLESFRQAEQENGAVLDADPRTEAVIIRQMLNTLPEGSLLFSGNSMPIRHLDHYSGKGVKGLKVAANRGASGIDGNISTLLGMAAVHPGKTVALLGDLTFFHDMNGLLLAKQANAVIVLLNNNGGGIFRQLSQAKLEQAQFERYWLTPIGLDFSLVAQLYGLGFERIHGADGFAAVFDHALGQERTCVIEVML